MGGSALFEGADFAAAAILLFFAYVIRRHAGLIGDKNISTIIKILSWIITAFLLLNTVGNLASQNVEEKILFAPITFVLAVACFVIASSRT